MYTTFGKLFGFEYPQKFSLLPPMKSTLAKLTWILQICLKHYQTMDLLLQYVKYNTTSLETLCVSAIEIHKFVSTNSSHDQLHCSCECPSPKWNEIPCSFVIYMPMLMLLPSCHILGCNTQRDWSNARHVTHSLFTCHFPSIARKLLCFFEKVYATSPN